MDNKTKLVHIYPSSNRSGFNFRKVILYKLFIDIASGTIPCVQIRFMGR